MGKDLQQARSCLLDEMKQVRADMNEMMLSAIDLGEQAMSGISDDNNEDYEKQLLAYKILIEKTEKSTDPRRSRDNVGMQ